MVTAHPAQCSLIMSQAFSESSPSPRSLCPQHSMRGRVIVTAFRRRGEEGWRGEAAGDGGVVGAAAKLPCAAALRVGWEVVLLSRGRREVSV